MRSTLKFIRTVFVDHHAAEPETKTDHLRITKIRVPKILWSSEK